MAKKPKLSKDAFDWVKSTSRETGKPAADRPSQSEPSPRESRAPRPRKGRKVFVRHKKRGGEIVAILEMPPEHARSDESPFINVPGEDDVCGFVLNDDLAEIDLVEIHEKFKVDLSSKTPRLVPRE
jgi:hypothetical protein